MVKVSVGICGTICSALQEGFPTASDDQQEVGTGARPSSSSAGVGTQGPWEVWPYVQIHVQFPITALCL